MSTPRFSRPDPATYVPINSGVRKKIKRRPARRQVTQEEAASFKKAPEQTGQTYNVWYNKWAGGDKYDAYNLKEKSQTRCRISTDAGYTRADGGNNAYCCVFFARGCCPYGSECTFLHRLPSPATALPDSSLDCFGREKHADYRDDMGGVGSFTRMNRTLYIGRLKETRDSEEMLERHFQEWGEIEKLRVLHGRGVGFVTYRSELSAQFAKEAMMHQSLDNDEVLNVRWATEDPNPLAKVQEHARLVKLGEEGIAKRLDSGLVQAVRDIDELDTLEKDNAEGGGEDVAGEAVEGAEHEGDVRPTKRIRQAPPAEPSIPVLPSAPAASTQQPKGLLSANALLSLQRLAQSNAQISAPAQPTTGGLMSLGGYGSGSDDDD